MNYNTFTSVCKDTMYQKIEKPFGANIMQMEFSRKDMNV